MVGNSHVNWKVTICFCTDGHFSFIYKGSNDLNIQFVKTIENTGIFDFSFN